MNGESSVEQFLARFSNPNTVRQYKRGIEAFTQWLQKDVDAILAERKEDLTPKPNESPIEAMQRADKYENLLERFHKTMTDKGLKSSTASNFCKGIMALFSYYRMEIRLRSGSPISEGFKGYSMSRYPLKPDDVRKMFWRERELKMKCIISMLNDLGWRDKDFVTIRVDELPSLNQMPPIEWKRITHKEREMAKTCLSADTVELLKQYLEVFKPKHWLWQSTNGGHISEDTINRRLKELANECGVETKPYSLSLYCFRDYILSQGKNLGIDGDILKLMTGKAVKRDMIPYLSGIDVRSAFEKLQTVTRINGNILSEKNRDELSMLTQQVSALMNRIETLEAQLKETQQKHHATVDKWLTKYEPLLKKLEAKFQD